MIQILKDSFQFFKSNFFKFLTLYVPIFFVQLAIGILIGLLPSSDLVLFLEFIVNMAIGSIYYSAVIFLSYDLFFGNESSAKEYLIKGLVVTPLVLFTDAVTILLTGGGLLLLIIPGIIIGAKLSLASFNLLLSKDKPIDAIKNSYRMTEGFTKTILGTFAIAGIPYFILLVGLRLFANLRGDFIISDFGINLMSNLFTTYFTVVLFRIYCLIKQQSSIA